jgi:hypothetical protein
MKTLTTLAAVAALVAGVSIANAAGVENHTLKGQETTNAAFCSQTNGGAMNCKFASKEACEKVAQPEGATCVQNPERGTTGSGMGKMK